MKYKSSWRDQIWCACLRSD